MASVLDAIAQRLWETWDASEEAWVERNDKGLLEGDYIYDMYNWYRDAMLRCEIGRVLRWIELNLDSGISFLNTAISFLFLKAHGVPTHFYFSHNRQVSHSTRIPKFKGCQNQNEQNWDLPKQLFSFSSGPFALSADGV